MKKIVIFGATGNIGMYLVDYLKDHLNCDYEIIAVGRQKKHSLNRMVFALLMLIFVVKMILTIFQRMIFMQ